MNRFDDRAGHRRAGRFAAAIALIGTVVVTAAPGVALAAPPSFSKVFTPDTIGPGSVSTLTFTIDNTAEASAADELAFADTLPAGVTIASPANASTSCTSDAGGSGPVLSAPGGGTTISLADAAVGAGATCTVTVDVRSATPGTHMNVSGDLTSSAGNSGTAADDLTVATDRPGFSKSFSPSTIDKGERSTLTFLIDNTANAEDVARADFTDSLPPGLVIADPANASTDCESNVIPADLVAVPGSNVITFFADGGASPPNPAGSEVVDALAFCTIAVDVVATAGGTLVNSSGNLSTSVGGGFAQRDAGKANATLTVGVSALHITKEFTDDPVPPGVEAALEFTIENFDRNFPATGVAFSDTLPAGVVLTTPSMPNSDCGGTLTADEGTDTISLTGGTVPAEKSCTIVVSVDAPLSPGGYDNETGAVSGTVDGAPVVGNTASDTLFVVPAPILTKEFIDDPVAAGGDVTLRFTITDTTPMSSTSDIEFEDDLSAIVGSDATAISVPADGFCGPGSSMTVVNVGFGDAKGIAMTNGSLTAGAMCTFDVIVTVPVGFSTGGVLNTTSEIRATLDANGSAMTGAPASDTLEVVGGPTLTKEFTDDPIAPGDPVTLEFTLTHDALAAGDATDITFTDDLFATVTGLTSATGGFETEVCDPDGAGADPGTGTITWTMGNTLLTFTGGELEPGESCTFPVALQSSVTTPQGVHPNETSDVNATVLGLATQSSPAEDDLVVAALMLTKEFTDDPVLPGGTVTLEFTIDNSTGADDATSILFTDDLDDTLNGLASTSGAPVTEACDPDGPGGDPGTGMVTWTSGATFLTFSGGELDAGESCTFSVTLLVPGGAVGGDYGNVTSNLSASIGGSGVILPGATDILVVDEASIVVVKEFVDDPVPGGDTVTLRFTVRNDTLSEAATGLNFIDDLDAALTGLQAVGLPASDVCGVGSEISGTSVLTFTGGSLAAAGECTFDVTLQVPMVGAGSYTNVTSLLSGSVGPFTSVTSAAPATDDLIVSDVTIEKSFDGPTTATGTPVLTFTLTNLNEVPVSSLAFSDDLEAVLSGLVATGLPLNDVCGAGSQISGTSFLTFTGGSLSALGSCTFDVDLAVPGAATAGTYPNATSDLLAGGLVVGTPATADLVVEPPPTFAKDFAPGAIGVGQTSTLTFTIDNSASAVAATALDFTDDLPAGVVIATPSNATTTCSGGTLIATGGGTTISYTGGTVGAGASCTVTVDVTGIAAGSHLNTSGDLTSTSGNSGTASDTLTVDPQPGFDKDFGPNPLTTTNVSTLTFTIDNSSSSVASTALDFSDTLPGDLVIATPSNAATTCIGGTLTAPDGGSTISYSGGSVAAGATCTVSVDVEVSTPGSHVNVSGDLTSSLGNSGNATDTLVMNPPVPTFEKVFAPNPILVVETSTLTFTIDNTASPIDATGLDFTDVLPAGVVIATPSNASTTCTGGTLTAADGGTTIAYTGGTVAAGTSCTVSVDVVSAVPGNHDNTSDNLTSSSGDSGPASDTLVVSPAADLVVNKTDLADPVAAGENVTYRVEVFNAGPSDATNVTVVDTVPAGLMYLSDTDSCTPGVPGPGFVTCDLGSVAVGDRASFQITFSVDPAAPAGVVTNTVDVSSDQFDPVTADNTDSENTTVVPEADLSITKTDLPDPVVAGETLTYTISVANAGPSDAADVVVTDFLPTGTSLGTTAGCAEDPGGIPTCSLGTILAGSSADYTITVTVDPAATGSILNESFVADLFASNEVPPAPSAGFGRAIVLADPMDGEVCFDLALFDLTSAVTAAHIHNAPAGVNGPIVVDLDWATNGASGCVPAAVAVIDAINAAPGDHYVNVHTMSIPSGEVRGQLDSATPAGAFVTSSTFDPDLSNNGASAETAITPEADLVIDKALVNTTPVIAGGSVAFDVTVTNLGPSDAVGVTVVDTVPAGLMFDFADVACTPGVPAAGFLTCDLGTIAAGDASTFGVVFAVDPGLIDAVAGFVDVSNQVDVASDTFDPDLFNNTDIEPFTVVPVSDLAVAKTDLVDPVAAGDTVTYRIEVSNLGPSDAVDVVAVDTFPAGLSFESDTGGLCAPHATEADQVQCDIATILAGDSTTFDVTFAVDPDATPGVVTNSVRVSSPWLDPDLGNDDDSEDTEIIAVADISVTKDDGRTTAVPGQDTIVYTIVVSNEGPSTAPSVAVADSFPSVLTCTWTSAASGGATGNTASGSGDIAETLAMPAGSSVTYTTSCSIDPSATGTLSNTVVASVPVAGRSTLSGALVAAGALTDPAAANNTATDNDTLLTPFADVSITKTDGLDTAEPGRTVVTYTIVTTNDGPSTDPAVELRDVFPASLTCSWKASVSGGATTSRALGSGTVDATLNMPPGSSVTVTATCTIDRNASGILTNTATATSSVTDPVAANNSATDQTELVRPPGNLPGTGGSGFGLMAVGALAALLGLALLWTGRRPRRARLT